MPAPTITSITPTLGHTGGRALAEIIGTNFREPTTQAAPSNGPVPVAPPSVRVLFGDVASSRVAWISSTRLFVETPIHAEATVDVTVENIDDDGVLIPGEQATSSNAFTFRRPQLTTSTDLTDLIRVLLRSLKLQVHPNIVVSVHTDFDDDTTDLLQIVQVASLPALVLQGPRLTRNRFYGTNQRPNIPSSTPEEFFVRREPYTVDVMFDLVGISNLQVEFQNFMQTTITYFHKNKVITHPRTGDDLELDFTEDGEPKAIVRFGNDNVKVFRGAIMIRGFDMDGFAGFDRDLVVAAARAALDQESVVELQPTTNLGETFPVGASPGLPSSSPAVTPAARTGLTFPKFGQNY